MLPQILKASVLATTLVLSTIGFAPEILAQLPRPVIAQPQDLRSSKLNNDAEREALQKSLLKSVFRVEVEAQKPHILAQNAPKFDGAAVAISNSLAMDIKAPKAERSVIEKASLNVYSAKSAAPSDLDFLSLDKGAQTNGKRYEAARSSFFGQGLEKSTSHFEKGKANSDTLAQDDAAPKQYFLTTADWLSTAQNIWIVYAKNKLTAKIEYRDEQRNLALLSTSPQDGIENRPLLPREHNLPKTAYVLLSPQTPYETLATAELNLDDPRQYGRSSLLARHGYAFFDKEGQLIALVVGPETTHKASQIVHHRLIWDAVSENTP